MEISYLAQVDRPCPVNLTNHAYFNLDGAGTDARAQRLQLFADRYLPVDAEGIPCAELTPVDGSGMDFRQPKTLLQDFLRDRDQQRVKGYDHAFLLHRTCGALECPAAHLWSADGQVQMSVFTDAPALQLYSGNYLAGTPARDGGSYANHAGVALESEFCRTARTIPNGRSRTVGCSRGAATAAPRIISFILSDPPRPSPCGRGDLL